MINRSMARVALVGALATATVPSGAPLAFAATTTPLSQQEFAAEIALITVATAANENSGWGQDTVVTFGKQASTLSTRFDPGTGRVSVTTDSPGDNLFAEVGTGTWQRIIRDRPTRNTLALLGRPGAIYVLTPDAGHAVAAVRSQAASASLAELAPIAQSVLKVVEDDGTIDYSGLTVDPDPAALGPVPDLPVPTNTFGVHTTSDGVIIGLRAGTVDTTNLGAFSATATISYGGQQITLPSPASTVTQGNLTKGLNAVRLPQLVHSVAARLARAAATMAQHAHRGVVASDIVAASKSVVAGSPVHISVTTIKGGVRLSSVNPYTHVTVSNTVVVEPTPVVHGGGGLTSEPFPVAVPTAPPGLAPFWQLPAA